MVHTMQNGVLTVSVDTQGAQLMSVRGVDGAERLWQGNPDIWKGRAPILFPFIGRLKGESYTTGGAAYSIKIHGFAQRVAWTLERAEPAALTFLLTDTEETRAQYPFRFECRVTYALEGDTLVKTHTVRNLSDGTMHYEIGGHDGYRVALEEGECMADSYVEFPGLSELHPFVNDENLMLTRETRTVPLQNGRLYLTRDLFALDALILEVPTCRTLTLASDKNSRRVTVQLGDYPYVGIWSRPNIENTNYVCIEPWSSLPDAAYLGTELAEKIGVRALAAGQEEALRYTMQFV